MRGAMGMVPGLLLPLAGWAAEPPATGWQLTPFAGYSSAIDFRAMDEPAPTPHGSDIDTLQGERSGSWGLFISREVDDPGMVELLYSHQSTRVSPELPDRLTVDTLQFAGALTLSDHLMAPYIGAGIGVTRFDAYDSETAPSMSLALGVQPRLTEHLAVRAEVRGYGSLVNDDSAFLCNPEVCAFRVRGELITQWQANIGLTLRF
ncbi:MULTISPECIES: outer membrane beta-barrel protein [Aeromonas]|uniref:outer membrane beta-barrel protein n=1 Tax=Aeromonas TaxID=642 RepID=UPI001C231B94|nr:MULTISPECIES: outer membrane beta-barrel protein [Aeromonas]MCR3938394.1 porin family protein [Aeromonas caviae]MCR3945971.1 porin family protein [Aeromonas caviae]QWZ55193.1 porin family protein [Aeromonas sp. FDAARGOS 1402]